MVTMTCFQCGKRKAANSSLLCRKCKRQDKLSIDKALSSDILKP